ncbi:pyrroline-5-carboxylate reductase dimerization domain-containing protein [Campylobacter sp. MG1]|uniref:pyrroline-5-carboxylate reductase dimerization domain-containing protein n=1 Tax=Campylobacter sp. MG1 TaxID=2976332 RepID=UPI00226CB39C|nr:pyrroline-5-carboxylate reductase dimerization domain-containing protein [Campylobacter sp. MG1]
MEDIYILGNGNMAKAIAKGLTKFNFNVCFVLRNINRVGDDIKNYVLYDNFDIENKICILCFKPYNLEEVANKFIGKCAKIIISPCAGVKLDDLKVMNAKFYARIMPNIAAEFNKSCTTYVLSDENNCLKDIALSIINALGNAIKCDSDKEIDLATAINGCAPAFLAVVAEAIANGGLSIGLKNEKSYELTRALFSSFESLINNNHPAIIKENVCSPAGISIKGVNKLEEYGIRNAFIKAIKESAT